MAAIARAVPHLANFVNSRDADTGVTGEPFSLRCCCHAFHASRNAGEFNDSGMSGKITDADFRVVLLVSEFDCALEYEYGATVSV